MKNRNIKRMLFLSCRLWAGIVAAITITACQQNEWDDHYQPTTAAEGSVIAVMQADGHFSHFLEAVSETGMGDVLSGTQTYTVWAPTDEAMGSADFDAALLDNHISRFLYGKEDLVDTLSLRVKMLNGKYVTFSRYDGYRIGDANLSSTCLQGRNGVVYGLDAIIPYYSNLYEKIQEDDRFSQIAAYLKTFDEDEFDGKKSISIGQNEYGQTVYDSIFNYHSYWMKHHGHIYQEDSTYTMLLPTNEAYAQGEAVVKPCYRTFGEMLTDNSNAGRSLVITRTYALDDILADSLQKVHTLQAMTGDLVFRRMFNPQTVQYDSLISTSGAVIHHPQAMFAGAVLEQASNGYAFVSDAWTLPAADTWNKTVRVEAETAVHRQLYTTTPTTYDATTADFIGQVSGGRYLEVENSSTSARMQPQIIFDLPGTLATAYNIYAVFAPGQARDAVYQGDSTRVNFYLNYVHEDGTMHEDAVISADPETGRTFVTNGNEMTRFLVAKNFRFPYANINMSEDEELETTTQETAVKIRIQTNVAANETTLMNKIMRIDCFILEPVIE